MNIKSKSFAAKSRAGFTLPEILVASTISVLVMGATMAFLISSLGNWRSIDAAIDAANESDMAISYMTYGVDGRLGLRSAIASTITPTLNEDGWDLSYCTTVAPTQTNSFTYSRPNQTLTFNPTGKIIGRNIEDLSMSSPNPAGVEISIRVLARDGNKTAIRRTRTFIHYRN